MLSITLSKWFGILPLLKINDLLTISQKSNFNNEDEDIVIGIPEKWLIPDTIKWETEAVWNFAEPVKFSFHAQCSFDIIICGIFRMSCLSENDNGKFYW